MNKGSIKKKDPITSCPHCHVKVRVEEGSMWVCPNCNRINGIEVLLP